MKRFCALLVMFAIVAAPCAVAPPAFALAKNIISDSSAQPHSSHKDAEHETDCPGHSHHNKKQCAFDCLTWLNNTSVAGISEPLIQSQEDPQIRSVVDGFAFARLIVLTVPQSSSTTDLRPLYFRFREIFARNHRLHL